MNIWTFYPTTSLVAVFINALIACTVFDLISEHALISEHPFFS